MWDSNRNQIVDLYWQYLQEQAKRNKQDEDEFNRAQREQQTGWGNDTVQGAQTGYLMSGGNPYGAMVGGIVGAGKGQYRAYEQRKREGQSTPEAFLRTIFDVKGSLPDIGVAGPAAQQAAGVQQKKKWNDAFAKQMQLGAMQAPPTSSGGGTPYSNSWDKYKQKVPSYTEGNDPNYGIY